MGEGGIPFVTSIANDIYDRVDKLATSLQKIPGILSTITKGFQQNLEKLNSNIESMLSETRGNRDLTLDAFSDSMTALSQQIRNIKEESQKELANPEMKTVIEKLNEISTKLNSSYWDVNILLIVNSIHWLVDLLQGKRKSIQVPKFAQTALKMIKEEAAPISQETGEPVTAAQAGLRDGPKFKGGRKPKTHDDHMAEIEKRRKLFGRY